MRRKLGSRSDIADAIIPKDFAIGCRRPTPGEGFLEALVEPNVTVWTSQMRRITEDGFIAHDGSHHQVDAIICATGFDTSWIPRFPVRAHGHNLQDIWTKEGALSYLAVGVPEFPNFFWFAGPVSSLRSLIESKSWPGANKDLYLVRALGCWLTASYYRGVHELHLRRHQQNANRKYQIPNP